MGADYHFNPPREPTGITVEFLPKGVSGSMDWDIVWSDDVFEALGEGLPTQAMPRHKSFQHKRLDLAHGLKSFARVAYYGCRGEIRVKVTGWR